MTPTLERGWAPIAVFDLQPAYSRCAVSQTVYSNRPKDSADSFTACEATLTNDRAVAGVRLRADSVTKNHQFVNGVPARSRPRPA